MQPQVAVKLISTNHSPLRTIQIAKHKATTNSSRVRAEVAMVRSRILQGLT
jgi:hypothetical protein